MGLELLLVFSGFAAALYVRDARARSRGVLEGGLGRALGKFCYGVERDPMWLGVDLKRSLTVLC